MEEAVSNFSTTIITFVTLITGAYMVITFAVHFGLKNVIVNKEIRNSIIKLTSVVVFGIIGMSMF